MKKFNAALFALTLALIQISYARANTPAPLSRSGAASPSTDKAGRAWRSFYPKFLRAVKGRDRASLRPMMVPEFLYSFGGGSDRDEAFRYWDEPSVRGWGRLEKVLAGGVSKPEWSTAVSDGSRVISRAAPPEAAGRGYIGWRAVFEYGADGRWRLAAFVAGD